MKYHTYLTLAVCLSLFSLVTNFAHSQERKDFVSDASFIVGTYQPAISDHTPKSMAEQANRFLKSLTKQQLKKVSGPLKGEVRREWTNLPARPDADGIRMGELKAEQIKAACDLMAALLSKDGYTKLTNIMLADDQLLQGGRRRAGFGTEDFSVVIFGKPSETKPWGFQLDGHHVGFNMAIEGDNLSMSPSFIGTQPESFKIAGKTYRPFAGEMDLAYDLVGSLNSEQLQKGIVAAERGNVRLGPGQDGRVPRKTGVACSTFSKEQKEKLLKLVSQWVNCLPPKHAKARMARIKKEIDQTYFAWSGDKKPKGDCSYMIHGPSLIIEYACQDLGGDPLNHLHSVYRDPTNEYGKQMD